jgi:hypothetical protein
LGERHCALPRAVLIDVAEGAHGEVGLVGHAIAEEVAEGTLVEDMIEGRPAVFPSWLFHFGRNIAEQYV